VIAALLASSMMLMRWNLVSKREIAIWSEGLHKQGA